MKDYNLGKRSFVIAGVAVLIVVIYILRLFQLQITSDDYKKSADSNAFLKKIEYPARGGIYDRNGKLLVYNQPAYDIMVVMNEAKDHLDTADFCNVLNITRQEFDRRMATIKDRNKNPGYSRFTQQVFMSQLDEKDFSVFQEKMFRFPGFYIQRRSIRQYEFPFAAHSVNTNSPLQPMCWEMWPRYRLPISKRTTTISLATISASWAWNVAMRSNCVARRVCKSCYVMPMAVCRAAI